MSAPKEQTGQDTIFECAGSEIKIERAPSTKAAADHSAEGPNPRPPLSEEDPWMVATLKKSLAAKESAARKFTERDYPGAIELYSEALFQRLLRCIVLNFAKDKGSVMGMGFEVIAGTAERAARSLREKIENEETLSDLKVPGAAHLAWECRAFESGKAGEEDVKAASRLLNNRAICHMKTKNWDLVKRDTDSACMVDGSFAKARWLCINAWLNSGGAYQALLQAEKSCYGELGFQMEDLPAEQQQSFKHQALNCVKSVLLDCGISSIADFDEMCDVDPGPPVPNLHAHAIHGILTLVEYDATLSFPGYTEDFELKVFPELFQGGGQWQLRNASSPRRRWGEYFHTVTEDHGEPESKTYKEWLAWATALDAHICETVDTNFATAKASYTTMEKSSRVRGPKKGAEAAC